MEIDKEMLKGYLDIVILSILAKERLYGYKLSKRIRRISNESFEIKEGTMYVVLKRLESKNFISAKWGDNGSEGARRKYYNITLSGIEYLKIQKSKWNYLKNILDIFFEEV